MEVLSEEKLSNCIFNSMEDPSEGKLSRCIFISTEVPDEDISLYVMNVYLCGGPKLGKAL
jgi:hypothetical protein